MARMMPSLRVRNTPTRYPDAQKSLLRPYTTCRRVFAASPSARFEPQSGDEARAGAFALPSSNAELAYTSSTTTCSPRSSAHLATVNTSSSGYTTPSGLLGLVRRTARTGAPRSADAAKARSRVARGGKRVGGVAVHRDGDGAVAHAEVVVEGGVVRRWDEDAVSRGCDGEEEVVDDGAAPARADAELIGVDGVRGRVGSEDAAHVRGEGGAEAVAAAHVVVPGGGRGLFRRHRGAETRLDGVHGEEVLRDGEVDVPVGARLRIVGFRRGAEERVEVAERGLVAFAPRSERWKSAATRAISSASLMAPSG